MNNTKAQPKQPAPPKPQSQPDPLGTLLNGALSWFVSLSRSK